MKVSKSEYDAALTNLHKWLKPGDTVYTILEHVSRSGMSRQIRVTVPTIGADGKVDFIHPNYAVGIVTGLRHAMRNGRQQDALVIGGYGSDMGFELVYTLSRKMFPTGFGCIGPDCPSNDHSNGDRDYTPHGDPLWWRCNLCSYSTNVPRLTCCSQDGHPVLMQPDTTDTVAHWHTDGGYALRQRWM